MTVCVVFDFGAPPQVRFPPRWATETKVQTHLGENWICSNTLSHTHQAFCVNTHTHTHTYMYTYMNAYVYMYVYIYMYIYIHVFL